MLQLWGLGVTLADERPIKLLPEHEPLWRCFLRRCGMRRLEFKQVLKCGRVRTFRAGEVIYKVSCMACRAKRVDILHRSSGIVTIV